MFPFDARATRVGIRRPQRADRSQFLQRASESAGFLTPWVQVPSADRFERYFSSPPSGSDDAFFIWAIDSENILGVINLNCIVRGFFQSAFLGYYSFQPFARQGYMTEGLNLVVRYAFDHLKLHRLEANIQPENAASIALVRKCGFHKEGFSPRYLQVMGVWRDHERWARLAEDSI